MFILFPMEIRCIITTTITTHSLIGNSGKSVLGSFIRRLYPKESVSSIRLKNLKNQFGMASLATSVINFDMDMSSSRIDDEAASRLKQITGGDSMNIPRKYRDDALLERRIKFVFSIVFSPSNCFI